jgi:hypothetical protein
LIGGNPFSADVHATERIHAAPTGALVMLLTSSAEMLWVPQLIGHSGEIRPRLPAVTADSMRNCTAGRTTRQHHSDAAGRTEKPFGKRGADNDSPRRRTIVGGVEGAPGGRSAMSLPGTHEC